MTTHRLLFNLIMLFFLVLTYGSALAQEDNGTCEDGTECINEDLKPVACSGANAFLGQVNIASVINLRSDRSMTFRLEYLDANGTVRGVVGDPTPAELAPQQKLDFIVNDLGLAPDTYGTVCVYTNTSAGSWAGGVTIYKQDTRNGLVGFGDAFDYALYYPFINPRLGVYAFPVNTFHLGTDPKATVANWLSIADATPGDSIGINGIVRYFNSNGTEVASDSVEILDGGRRDFPAHARLTGGTGEDAVGMAQFDPTPLPNGSEVPYYITLTRYFYDCPGASCSNFLTAFTAPLRPATSTTVSGGAATLHNELSIVEINNTSAAPIETQLSVRAGVTATLSTVQLPVVPPFGTFHAILNFNPAANSGFIEGEDIASVAATSEPGFMSASSLFYRLGGAGELLYGYAAPLVGSAGSRQVLEFNTFIGHVVELELYNSSTSDRTYNIRAVDSSGTVLCDNIGNVLAARTTRRFTMLLPKDRYGTILLEGFGATSGSGLVTRSYVRKGDAYTLALRGVRAVNISVPPPALAGTCIAP